jgi:hypothetical protein
MDTSNVWRDGWVKWLRWVGVLPLGLILLFAMFAPFVPASVAMHERLVVNAFGSAVYLGVFLVSMYLFSDPTRREGERRWSAFVRAFAWVRLWHGMVFAAVATGALIGGILFSLIGTLIGMEPAPYNMLLSGLRDGAFYVFIWAPGASLIACVMLAFHGRKT